MRDAKQLTEFTLTNTLGTQFEIIGTYLTPSGNVYLKIKDTIQNVFVNHYVADFKVFLTNAGLTVSIEPTSLFENENFVSEINQTIEL